MQEKYDIAETFLERVISQSGDNVIAWTLYAYLYERRGQELNADITYKRANKLNQQLLQQQQQQLLNGVTAEFSTGEQNEIKKEEGSFRSKAFLCSNSIRV
jgi:tetratricopeptide (TPR) repeat protein